MGHEEEDKERCRTHKHTQALRFYKQLEMQPNARKTLIYPGVMTQLDSVDSSEAESDKDF